MKNQVVRLNELGVGERAVIVKVGAADGIWKRLLEMGLVKGTLVELERFAPLGDPLEVRALGYHLSLRRKEARQILVRRLAG